MSIRRSFKRPLGKRRYKKLFIIAVEGSKTERQYFAIFNTSESNIVKCLERKNTKSAPLHVLKRMKEYLRKEVLRRTDEAWLVVDKDIWPEDHLRELMHWEQEKDNYGFALSNPNFEYWLLLHFEEGKSSLSANECMSRLRNYLPDYRKEINKKQITRESIQHAIQRAKQQKINNKTLLLVCGSTIYRLVEKILRE